MTAPLPDDDLTVLPCWECVRDGVLVMSRAETRCWKCQGTGSVFWVDGRSYPYTPEGEKRARAARQ